MQILWVQAGNARFPERETGSLSGLSSLGIIARIVSISVLPIVIVAGILVTLLIGAFQLRNDERLSQESFMPLVKIMLDRLPMIGRLAKLFARKDKP